MFGFSYDRPVETPEPEYKIEETELEKVLKNIDLDEFFNINIREELNLNTESILGNQEQISQMLKEGITGHNHLMENVEKDLREIDFKIDFYRSLIFEDGKRDSKIRSNNFLLKKGCKCFNFILSIIPKFGKADQFSEMSFTTSQNYLTEAEVEEKIKDNEMYYPTLKIEKKSITRSNAQKSIENLNYSGFSDYELTELPGHVEAVQLLNNLSTKMGFKKNFLKYWTVIIRTDASIAILLDSFWWFYLKYFKNDPSLEIDAYKFFSRIAESFAALLLNIHPSMRDRFFENYATFLSQAIYLAFFNVFPDCILQLNDQFKQEICNTVHEWVLGLRPIPESYQNWQINDEINVTGDTKVSQNNEILTKISNLEKLLNSLGEKNIEIIEEQDYKNNDLNSDFEKILNGLYKKKNFESHVVGEGSLIEAVPFNLKGKSVLINHYMNLHSLKSDSSIGFKITRSEIVQNPPKTAVTYRDKIYETLERAKTLDEAFRKTSEENQLEIKRIEKERKRGINEFKKLKRSSSSPLSKESSEQSISMKKKSASNTSLVVKFDEIEEKD